MPKGPVAAPDAPQGAKSAQSAGRLADGLNNTEPDASVIEAFQDAGGEGKACYGQLTVCWASDEQSARRIAHEWWPNAGLPSPLSQELRTVQHFDQATKEVTEEKGVASLVCGPDARRHRAAIQEFADAGYDHVYIHQVGPDQEGFFQFYAKEIVPYFGND